jgi:hypothetical protein
MSTSLQKLFKENSIGALVLILLIAGGVYYFASYLSNKGSAGSEGLPNSKLNPAYFNGPAVQPAEPQGQNEVYSSANGAQTSGPGISTCNNAVQNPADLLPKDGNTQWAQLNPSGKGELANVNLLKAGYHIGIDTIGQSLRNANQQIRSEPPNPQQYTGPWNMSTIEPDFMRPPLEIGAGAAQ